MYTERTTTQKHQTRTDIQSYEHHSDKQRKPSTQRAHPSAGAAIPEHQNKQHLQKERAQPATNINSRHYS